MKLREENGSAAAEFALIAPLLALILGAVMEAGAVVQTALIARNAAREGARYAAVFDPIHDAPNTAATKTLAYLTSAVGNRSDVVLPTLTQINVSSSGNVGDPVTVFVPVSVRVSMPVISDLMGTTVSVNGAATMRVTQ